MARISWTKVKLNSTNYYLRAIEKPRSRELWLQDQLILQLLSCPQFLKLLHNEILINSKILWKQSLVALQTDNRKSDARSYNMENIEFILQLLMGSTVQNKSLALGETWWREVNTVPFLMTAVVKQTDEEISIREWAIAETDLTEDCGTVRNLRVENPLILQS